MKKRKKRRQNMFLLLVWTMFLFLMLTSSTYAWFTVNRAVSIESFDIKVNVKGVMEISTDGENWKNGLTSEDIIKAHENYENSVNQLPDTLEPVSTGGNLNSDKFLDMYYGVTQKSEGNEYYSLKSTVNKETEGAGEDSGKFIAFDTFIKFSSESPLYLTSDSGTSIPEDGNDTGIGNAVRVAFINEGMTSVDSNKQTIQNLKNATNDDVIIWEPNYDIHTEHGVNSAKNIYGINTSITGGQRLVYDGIIHEFTYANNISVSNALANNYPSFFKTVDVDIATKNDFNTYEEVLHKVTRGIYKIRIYIWIEGQDVDCEDHASTGDILFNIQFSTLNE